MAITDRKFHKSAQAAKQLYQASRDNVPISQADLLVGRFRPGHKFRVTDVEVFCSAVAATASVQVRIGATSVLTGAITPVAADRAVGTLSAVVANLEGESTEDINVEVTTNGTGTIDDLVVSVRYRPRPVVGEAE